MASPVSQGHHPPLSKKASPNLILKEGFLYKKGGIIKSWSRRYFILMRESLCYFRREVENQQGEPMGRIFLSDIVNIETEGVEKKKAFVFALHTKKRALLFQAANSEDRDRWVESIRMTLETDKEAERKDPFRKTLRKLAHGELWSSPPTHTQPHTHSTQTHTILDLVGRYSLQIVFLCIVYNLLSREICLSNVSCNGVTVFSQLAMDLTKPQHPLIP